MKIEVDAATTDELLSLFNAREDSSIYKWNYEPSLNFTSLLLKKDLQLYISQSLTKDNKITIRPRQLKARLGSTIKYIKPKKYSDEIHKYVNSETEKFIEKNITEISSNINSMINEEDSYWRWSISEKENAWLDFKEKYNGLFNYEHIKYLSEIFNLSEIELDNLHLNTIKRKVSDFKNNDIEQIKKLYFGSVILRGINQQAWAKKRQVNIIQHPIRQKFHILTNRNRNAYKTNSLNPENHITFVESTLSHLIIQDALKAKSLELKLDRWKSNISHIRQETTDKAKQIQEINTIDDSIRLALDIFNNSRIKINFDQEKFIQLSKAIGIGLISQFTLLPFNIASILGTLITSVEAVTGKNIGQRIASAKSNSEMNKVKNELTGIIIPSQMKHGL